MMKFSRWLALTALVTVTACAQSMPDLNRTRDNKVKKSLFSGQWFALSTVVDTPAQSRLSFIGLQGSGELVEWDVQERMLLAYRVHEHVEGAEVFGQRPGTKYRGAVVAAYPIQGHFDVKRGYNAATGEQSNVISENGSDRKWHEREYIRVDWGKNMIADLRFDPDNFTLTSGGDFIHENADEPGALDVAEDHINITSRVMVAPINSSSCFYGWREYDDNTMDCEASEVTYRTSFRKLDPVEEATYEKMYYDDLRYNKFGNFRVNRYAYNRDYGVRFSNTKFLSTRWNIWESATDANGNALEPSARTPQPIVFYLNAEFPYDNAALVEGNAKVEAQWDEKFRNAVAAAQNVDASSVRQMYYICDNPVRDYGADTARQEACGEVGLSPLLGDLRYPMVNYITQPHLSAPLGYGPSTANPLTGRLLHGTANLYGASLNTYVQYATDMVKLLNGDLEMDEFLEGYYESVLSGSGSSTLTAHRALDGEALSKFSAKNDFHGLSDQLGESVRNGSLDGDWSRPLADAVAGTRFESLGLTPEMVHAFSGGETAAADHDAHKFSPANMIGREWFTEEKARKRYLERNGCIFAPEFSDTAIAAVARRLQSNPEVLTNGSIDYDKVGEWVRKEIYVAVLLHELGHTFGMAHNFAASTDALNYDDNYWRLRTADGDVEPLFSMDPAARQAVIEATDEDGHTLREYQYSSIMEYGRRWMSDIGGLGKYDNAWTKYVYGGTVEVWDVPGVQEDAYDGLKAKLQPHNYHYSQIPELLKFGGGGSHATAIERINMRRDIPWSDVGEEAGQVSPDREVFYRFCDNTHGGRFAWCNPFDEGADQYEVVAAVAEDYEGYYPFYNFRRNRLGFGVNLNGYINRILGRLMDVSDQYKHFVNEQMFLRGGDCIDPVTGNPVTSGGQNLKVWESPVCGGDGMAASQLGFDLLARIIQQPDLGTYVWNEEDDAYEGFDLTYGGSLPDPAEDPEYDLDKQFELMDSPARDHETRYNRDRFGYGFYYKPESIGVWWDKYMALYAFILPGANFAYVDSRPDMVKYSMNWSYLFAGPLMNLSAAVATRTYKGYAPLYDEQSGDLEWRRFTTASTADEARYAASTVINPGDSFTVRYLSILLGAGWMQQSSFDKSFNENFKIGVVGARDGFEVSDEVKADPERYVEVTDQVNYRTYFAVNTGAFGAEVGTYGGHQALSAGYTLLKQIHDLYLDADGSLSDARIAAEAALVLDDEVADAIEELVAIAGALPECLADQNSFNCRVAKNQATARATNEVGPARAQERGEFNVRRDLHNAFYFPDLIRGLVHAYENR
jgi:hypothetical protein